MTVAFRPAAAGQVARCRTSDQTQIVVLRRFAIDLTQELQLLDVAMALRAWSDDLTITYVECGEHRRGAVALVVVGHCRGATRVDCVNPQRRLSMAGFGFPSLRGKAWVIDAG